jgi:hypothetical protein
MTAHGQAAGRAEAVLAAVNRRTPGTRGDARLAEHRDLALVAQRALDRAQLPVDLPERPELREHELIVSGAEPVEVEDEPAEVAVRELAGFAQEAEAPAQAPPRGEARRPVGTVRAGRDAVGRRWRGGRLGRRGWWLLHA